MLVLMAEQDVTRFQASLNAMKEVGVAFDQLTQRQLEETFPMFKMASFAPPKLLDDPWFRRGRYYHPGRWHLCSPGGLCE